tara:strand:+ start:205 stop:555 length:351 start_codon:yes stop_codon:yes gene_type:complete
MKYFEKIAISSKLIQSVTDSRLKLLRSLQNNKATMSPGVSERAISSLKSRSRRQSDNLRWKYEKKEDKILSDLDSRGGASGILAKTRKAQDHSDSQGFLRRFHEAVDKKRWDKASG